MYLNVLQLFHNVLLCSMIFREWRNDRRRRIDDRAAADRLKDRDNAAGIGNNSAEISDDAAGIIDITAKVTPS